MICPFCFLKYLLKIANIFLLYVRKVLIYFLEILTGISLSSFPSHYAALKMWSAGMVMLSVSLSSFVLAFTHLAQDNVFGSFICSAKLRTDVVLCSCFIGNWILIHIKTLCSLPAYETNGAIKEKEGIIHYRTELKRSLYLNIALNFRQTFLSTTWFYYIFLINIALSSRLRLAYSLFPHVIVLKQNIILWLWMKIGL